jgi:uncharacterized protein YjbJ (UPF0337 family)
MDVCAEALQSGTDAAVRSEQPGESREERRPGYAEPVTRTDAAEKQTSTATQRTCAIPTSNSVRLISCRRGVSVMNKDEVKGKMKNVVGRAERELGKATGNKKTEARGVARQAEGKLQNIVGKVKDTIRKKAA